MNDPPEMNLFQEYTALVAQMGLNHKVFETQAKIIEEQNRRLYALEQDNKLYKTAVTRLQREFSELSYKFAELRQECRK